MLCWRIGPGWSPPEDLWPSGRGTKDVELMAWEVCCSPRDDLRSPREDFRSWLSKDSLRLCDSTPEKKNAISEQRFDEAQICDMPHAEGYKSSSKQADHLKLSSTLTFFPICIPKCTHHCHALNCCLL